MSLRTWLAEQLAGAAITARVDAAAEVAATRAVAAVREAFPGPNPLGQDAALTQQGFRLVSSDGTRLLRDLQPMRQDIHLRAAYWLWESNPVAKWIIETTVDFILGEGAAVTSEIPEVQAAIRAFWGDGVNRLDERLDDFARELRLNGELCLPVAVNDANGHVRLAYVDPLDIAEVLTDPDNVLITTGVVLRAPLGGAPRVLKVIREVTNPLATYGTLRTEGLLMPALANERVTGRTRTGEFVDELAIGSCLFFQVNKVSNARRGRSDLTALIDWLDGYDQFMYDSMDGASRLNEYVWDVTLEGADERKIEDYAAKQGRSMPKRGQTFYHNEKVKRQALTPDLKAQDKDAYAKLLLSHIIGSEGFPLHFYGSADGATGAAAKEMGMPATKRLSRKQRQLRVVIRDLVRFALHQKVVRGLLKPTYLLGQRVDGEGNSQAVSKSIDEAFQIKLPELSVRDQSAIVAAMTGLGASLTQAEAQGWIRGETAAALFAHVATQLGFEVRSDEEYTPGAGPAGAALQDYSGGALQQMVERLLAQNGRVADGNGEPVGQAKGTPAV